MRRVAIIEEAIENNNAPTRKRELIAGGFAVQSITLIIIAIVFSS